MTSLSSKTSQRRKLLIELYEGLRDIVLREEIEEDDEDFLDKVLESVLLWREAINDWSLHEDSRDATQERMTKLIELLFEDAEDFEEEEGDESYGWNWVMRMYYLTKLILCHRSRAPVYGKKKFRNLTVDLEEVLREAEELVE